MRQLAIAVTLAAAGVPSALSREIGMLSIRSICDAERFVTPRTGPRTLNIEAGMGNEGFKIPTNSPEAQRWFNYGVTLWHAFQHEDAKIAFDKAVEADPICGMCLWGQALSRGPTQNFDLTPEQQKDAAALAKRAVTIARTPIEQALSEALVTRYAAKQDGAAEIIFANATLKAARLQPDAHDLRLVAAEALLTAWRRGDHAGTAERAMALVEPILRRERDNPAAIHYWIHATEFAGQPALALPYASRLADLTPKASHLIHMASHTYLRLGYYEEAASVNARALLADARHAESIKLPGPLGAADYYPHNVSMGLEGALMAGDGALALKFARHISKAFQAGFSARAAYITNRAFVAYGRHDPDEALRLPKPSNDAFGVAMWRYARGEAFVVRGDSSAVEAEAQALAAQLQANRPQNEFENSQADLALRVLQGRAAMLKGDTAEAVHIFRQAATLQENFNWGMDPPPWWYPIRRSLAAAELKLGRAADAAKDAHESLRLWPRDGLALHVLGQANAALGNRIEARKKAAESRKIWRGKMLSLDQI